MRSASLGISGLLTLNLHSLNNEGSEGNYLQTRQVQIVDENGDLKTVNAISGDMFKHIQAEHLYYLAKERGLPLCNGCETFNANRIVIDQEFADRFEEKSQENEILSGALQTCIIDDMEGILITSKVGGKKRSIGRKSVIEFGWVVGRPESTRTDSFFHVKYVSEGQGNDPKDESGANLGQNIFHRPASSGQYAVVLNLDLYRIGRNDITQELAISEEEQLERAKALLTSVLYTMVKPSGAHRNTQNPHITAFEGCFTLSNSTVPAPLASALNKGYREEIEQITTALNKVSNNSISYKTFNTLSDFSEKMSQLILTL